jgi:hypothetical protein
MLLETLETSTGGKGQDNFVTPTPRKNEDYPQVRNTALQLRRALSITSSPPLFKTTPLPDYHRATARSDRSDLRCRRPASRRPPSPSDTTESEVSLYLTSRSPSTYTRMYNLSNGSRASFFARAVNASNWSFLHPKSWVNGHIACESRKARTLSRLWRPMVS